MIICCENCGGTNIETKAWIDPNTDTVFDNCSDSDIEDNWCRDCDDHVKFGLKSDIDG